MEQTQNGAVRMAIEKTQSNINENTNTDPISAYLPIMEDSAGKIKQLGENLIEEYQEQNKRKDALGAINALWKSTNIYKMLIDIKTK